MKSKIFSVCLLIAVVLGSSFIAVNAAEKGTIGNNIKWVLDDDGILVISGKGEVEAGSFSRSEYREKVKKVIIEEGITGVGNYTFNFCDNITEIILPESFETIGEGAFNYTSISTITLPQNVKAWDGESPFSNCTNLQEFKVASGNKQLCTIDGVLFSKDMESLMMYPAGKLQNTYTVPESVSIISKNAFSASINLEQVYLPSGLNEISMMGFIFSGIKKVNLPQSLKYLGFGAFQSTQLTSVVISDNIKSIPGHAFQMCYELKNVYIPDTVTSIDDAAFWPNEDVVIICSKDSYAYQFAIKNGYDYKIVETNKNDELSIAMNGADINMEQKPLIVEGRTLVPLRGVFENIGATVEWNDKSREIISKLDDITVTMKIDSSTMMKDDEKIPLDVSPTIIDGYTYIPVRAVAEAFGADVDWIAPTRTVYINYEKKPKDGNLVPDSDYWEFINFDDGNELLSNAENKKGDNFILVYYSRYCPISQYAVPMIYNFANENKIKIKGLDEYNTLNSKTTALYDWDDILGANEATYPMVFIYSKDKKRVFAEQEVSSEEKLKKLLKTAGYDFFKD